MTELFMTPEEKIDAGAILEVFKELNPDKRRQLFYIGVGMHYGDTSLSKEVEEKEDAKSSTN